MGINFLNSNIFTKEQIDVIYNENLGYWVNCLYGWGNEFFSEQLERKLTYEEEAEVFLALFKRMIDDGLILAISPTKDAPEKEIDGLSVWDVSSDKMIEYIRSVFPKDIIHLKGLEDTDTAYIKFWYEDCPEIYWVDKETGKIFLD
ncbi:Uncharacterized protein conserved in bacteria [Campylobacter sputorum subsp. bubulus]|uniref:Uncharacterized protein conserved in bacteria n=1 Tax=Campylobacter sputorum subsp. sputorum TaxID=32024 RepID=A0A381DHQ9_9BACT|nr:hypothetical protein [Campylobacter sputorum]ASM35197.1 hypothetical protein CSPUT_0984 [Campylobacter sputorum aubsp. sputorum RM3237]ASM36856.1 hypothetical protein CSF_0987 [Campylobacter sputorum bv. faecalis CCUG 20703]KAB0580996.1 hypothetical protein F7P64_07715 [Campylobacter sputorum subsp. sputorum]QEL05386.1 hypothetical protein CSPT_0981 [Campylobacter sputorum subsp. sputorum]SUX08804.1 Uncharacterized protein conserved in bacteria [Campylobacter sputorum subsp. bubulus]